MNSLLIGIADKSPVILSTLDYEKPFLLIDDGPLIDSLTIPPRRKVTRLDFTKHSFNILQNISYRTAREFIAVLDTVFPEGANTLTKKNANFVILKALLNQPKRLDKLIRLTKEPADIEAHQKLATLFFSPTLKRVLCNPTNFPLDGIILARINRAELGDFDAFVIALLLIGQVKGQVIVPDFGFYGRDLHTSLIRQNRLVVGVNFLAELPPTLRQAVLTIKDKTTYRTTLEDAERLLPYFRKITKPSQITELEGGEFLTTGE